MEELKRGFKGWHQRGYLPHFDAPHVTQFVTFQLADSFPIKRRAEWEPILRESNESEKKRKLEAWLDRGHGACWLRRDNVASLVEGVLREKDGIDFALCAWVIMPNHVHLVVDVWDTPLSHLIRRWKGRSSRLAKIQLGGTNELSTQFWQEDYYDTIVRDEEHLRRARRYTENNPLRAYLVRDPRKWRWSSARHRDKYGRFTWEQNAT